MKLSKITPKQLTKIAIVAAIYIVSTLAIAPIGYGAIQFRISEVLNLLVFINPLYGVSLILGCAVSNIFSPLGMYDVLFGTLATALTVVFIAKTKNLFIASLWPSLFNSIIIGLGLHYITNAPLIITALSILVSEFIIMTLIAYPLFKVLTKKQKLISLLKV